MSEARLTDLEARYAWLERHLAEQDRAVLALSDELRRLRQELLTMRERTAMPAPSGEEPQERPPHY